MRKKTEEEIAEKIEKQLKSKLTFPLNLTTSFGYTEKFKIRRDPKLQYLFDTLPEGYEIYETFMALNNTCSDVLVLTVFDTSLETIIFIEEFSHVSRAVFKGHPLSITEWKRF